MNRTLLGALGTLLLAAAGLFWWQGRAAIDPGAMPPHPAVGTDPLSLPSADWRGIRGPELPQATEQTREQRRFDRLDRDRNGRISRLEMLVPRAALFRKLDADGNNLLTFEEWAVVTSNRFKGADANGNGQLDRTEFATTKPKPAAQPVCKCVANGKRAAPKPDAQRPDPDAELDQDGQPIR